MFVVGSCFVLGAMREVPQIALLYASVSLVVYTSVPPLFLAIGVALPSFPPQLLCAMHYSTLSSLTAQVSIELGLCGLPLYGLLSFYFL